jgi:hypothetical protein
MAGEMPTTTMVGPDGSTAIVNICDVADWRGRGYRLESDPPAKQPDAPPPAEEPTEPTETSEDDGEAEEPKGRKRGRKGAGG